MHIGNEIKHYYYYYYYYYYILQTMNPLSKISKMNLSVSVFFGMIIQQNTKKHSAHIEIMKS